MMTKRLLSAFTALIITGFMFTGNHAVAQVTKTFATSVSASNTATSALTGVALTSAQQAEITDNSLTTHTRINTTATSALVNTGYVEVQFTSPVPANTTSYVKIDIESGALLGNLVGGAVGNLVNGLLGALVRAQGISVQVKKADGSDALGTTSNFNQDVLRIVRDKDGNSYIAVRPTSAYNRIRINNNVAGLLYAGTMWMDIYGAYYETGSGTNCVSGNYTSYNGSTTGILTADLRPVPTVQNAIDGILTTSSDISLGTVNVTGTYVEQVVYFSGTSATTDKYNIRLGMSSALLALDVLSTGVQILGYSGTNATPVYTTSLNDSQFLSLNIGTSINAGQPFAVQIAPTVAIDRIAIRLNGAVNINAVDQALKIYEVTRGSFGVTVTGGNTFTVGQAATLGTSFTGCSSTSYTYSWTGTGGFTSTSATPTIPTTVAGTYTYTVVVTNDFGIKETATITVQVFAPGTISAAQTVCTGDAPANLTLSGNTANVIRWEKSTDSTFATGVTQIAVSGTTLAGSSVGPITATTYVRAVTQATGYDVVNSLPVTLTVKSTTWNGSGWSNGAPDIATTAIITGNYSQTGNLTACSLQVTGATTTVTFATGTLVTLEKFINVAAGSTVTFENNAHLVQHRDDAINTGNIVAKRNSSDLFRLDYTIWSSPVASSQTLLQFSPNTAPTRFYQYRFDFDAITNTNTESYYAVSPSATTFGVATSYLIRMPNTDLTPGYNEGTTTLTYKGQFTGVPNNGIITKAFSTQGNRYTSIGNPYPSPISVIDFFNTNSAVIDQASALYFWRKRNNNNASTYATLTKIAYVANNAVGGNPDDNLYGGQQWETLFNGSNPSTWIINPAQGFIVQSKIGLGSPVVTFNNAMRRGTINNQFFRPSQQDDLSRVWLNLKGASADTNAFSQIAIAYTSEATTGIDAGYDGRAFVGDDAATLFTTAADTKLTIQARPAFTTTDVVPMGYTLKNAGQYTISINRKDGVFNQGQNVYVKDNELGLVHNLSDGDYTFTSQAGEFTNRLEVVYTTTGSLGTNNPVLNPNTVVVYQQESVINIKSDITDITAVSVYDIRGRMLFNNNKVNAPQTSITGLQAQHQVLIVEVTTSKGKVSKKIVF